MPRGFPVPAPLRVLGAACFVAALALVGCTRGGSTPLLPPVVLADPTGLPVLPAVQLWSTTVPMPLTVSMAGDGSAVAGSSLDANGNPAPWAFNSQGGVIPLPGAVGSAVFALPGSLVAVGPGVADPPGPTTIIGADGPLWSRATVGPVDVVANATGSRIGVVDDGNDVAAELALNDAGTLTPLAVPRLDQLGPSAAMQFDPQGHALVVDAHGATLLGLNGQQLWHLGLNTGGVAYDAVVDADGGGVTAATAGSDHTLYRFALESGRLRPTWVQALPAGGTDQLLGGPPGEVVVVGVGDPATLAMYQTSDGAQRWQVTLPTVAQGAAPPEITGAAVSPAGDVELAVQSCTDTGGSCILKLDGDGQPTGVVDLPIGAEVQLAADGEAAAVVAPGAGAFATLSWLALAPPSSRRGA